MIRLQKISNSNSQNMVYHQFHPHQKFGYAALSYYPAECAETDFINAHILNSVLKFDIEKHSEDNVEDALKEFFVQLNWQLYSIFKEKMCVEKGISFVLIINYNENIVLIPFGRFICGIWDEKGFIELGSKWENFTVKSMEKLNFLGNIDKDIKSNIIHHNLKNGSSLLLLPANKSNFFSFRNWNETISEIQLSKEEFPHIFLSNGFLKDNKATRKQRKLQ